MGSLFPSPTDLSLGFYFLFSCPNHTHVLLTCPQKQFLWTHYPGIQRIILFFDLIGCGQLTQAGHVLIFGLAFGFFSQLLFMAANNFIQLFQALMQSAKKGIKCLAQGMLGLVLFFDSGLPAVFVQVLVVSGLHFFQIRPLFDKIGHGLFAVTAVQHLQQVFGYGLHLGFAFSEPFHALFKIVVNELDKFFAFAFVQMADDGDVPDLFIRKLAVGMVGQIKPAFFNSDLRYRFLPPGAF